jgi:hypothetical protein
MTWDRRLYFPSEGRNAKDFFALKNPMASAGFEPAILGTRGQHANHLNLGGSVPSAFAVHHAGTWVLSYVL